MSRIQEAAGAFDSFWISIMMEIPHLLNGPCGLLLWTTHHRLPEQAQKCTVSKSAHMLSHFSCILILCKPMDLSPPDSSVHGILQAKWLEWVTMPSSRGSSPPRDWTWVCLLHWPVGSLLLALPGKPKITSRSLKKVRFHQQILWWSYWSFQDFQCFLNMGNGGNCALMLSLFKPNAIK